MAPSTQLTVGEPNDPLMGLARTYRSARWSSLQAAQRGTTAAPAYEMLCMTARVLRVATGVCVLASNAAAQPIATETTVAAPEQETGDSSTARAAAASFDATLAASIAAAELIEIDDTAPAESASSVQLSVDDLRVRSRTQISDLLRHVPGLMVSQHAGGGKSDQYFIRGFDADHGTDIAIFADGVLVNMPSHGHGQGYADMNFLIPETVESIAVHKGPYAARFGDFYTAGAMELKTIDKVDHPTVVLAGGAPLAGPRRFRQYNRRVVGMASPQVRDSDSDRALIAAQIASSDGPFENEQALRQGNALVKWKGTVGRGDLALQTSWYAAKWNASGQIPESAVRDGTIDRFGSLDPSEGGSTSRTSFQLGYTLRDERGGTWRASAFGVEYSFLLFSNFTYYARDPVRGDEIEQGDSRFVWGLDTAYDRRFKVGGHDTLITVGTQIRNDDVRTSLWHVERRRRLGDCFAKATNPCNNTDAQIRSIGAYMEANVHVLDHVHVLPGLRFQQFVWAVDDLDPSTRTDPDAATSGNAGRAMLLPKLSVEAEATSRLNLFANAGNGFHSNDARSNVASNGAGSLARALGAEVGVRTTYVPRTRVAAALWYLHLDSELVWSGDAGGTEPSDASRRHGVDLEASHTPVSWLKIDATLSVARATLVETAGTSNGLALAPRIMGQGGITFIDGSRFVSLRGRGIGDRPGNDDGTLTADGYLIFDLVTGAKVGDLDLNLTVNNVLDSEWREAQFAAESRVSPAAEIVEQMHYTPGIPLTATVTAGYTF